MTTSFDFDRSLRSVLEDGPQAASPSVVESALTAARDVAQRRPVVGALDRLAWPARLHLAGATASIRRSAMGRALLLVLLVLALMALGLAGAGALRGDPPPKSTATAAFIRPFEYEIAPDSLIRQTADLGSLVAWVEGPDAAPDPSEVVNPGRQPATANVHGIIVGSGEEAWSHGSKGRFMLRTPPAEFLADLRDIAHVPMGAIAETTLDGRPAVTTRLPGNGGSDIHVNGHMQGLSGTFAIVTIPSRLIVGEIDGTTVFILIWARTSADLETWMPEADAFVRSIHFLPTSQP